MSPMRRSQAVAYAHSKLALVAEHGQKEWGSREEVGRRPTAMNGPCSPMLMEFSPVLYPQISLRSPSSLAHDSTPLRRPDS